MKNFIKRILLFVLGVPALIAILLFVDQFNHLAFSIIVLVFCIIGSVEFAALLGGKNMPLYKAEAAILGAIAPLSAILYVSFDLQPVFIASAFCIGASWVLVSRVFSPTDKLDLFLNRAAAGLAVLIYPGLLTSWIIALFAFNRSEVILLTFLLIVFLNDGAAWGAGILFGKKNRGIIPASPKKSIAGYAGGLIFSAGIGILAVKFFPDAFPSDILPWYIAGGILGLGAGLAGCLGDLAESCLKRSAGVKDSGKAIPGRGGILDSIDSISLAAPLYYLIFRLLFT